MLVECLGNRGEFLPAGILNPLSNFTEDNKFALVVGQSYVVYAITQHRKYVLY